MDCRWQIGLIVALAALVLACGSTAGTGGQTIVPAATSAPAAGATNAPAAPEATAAPATASIAKVGDRIEQNGTALTVVSVEKKAEISDFQKAKAGNTFVLAEVLIENTGAEKLAYNLLYFKVKDADGFEENATIYTGDGGLSAGELAGGEKVRGIAAFEVKEAATGLVLSYKPITIGADDPIRVALE